MLIPALSWQLLPEVMHFVVILLTLHLERTCQLKGQGRFHLSLCVCQAWRLLQTREGPGAGVPDLLQVAEAVFKENAASLAQPILRSFLRAKLVTDHKLNPWKRLGWHLLFL